MGDTLSAVNFLINKASFLLNENKLTLGSLLQKADDIDDEGSNEEDKIHAIQLTLQYRLSCEDALSLLFQLDHNLLYFLGIQPQQSAQTNRERLAYAVGNEDLKQILNILAVLTGSLSKIIAQYKSNYTPGIAKNKRSQKYHMLLKELSLLLGKQKQFFEVLHKLDLEIGQLLKLQSVGPVFDHIAALRGPISQFYQAILSGLEQTKPLYQYLNKKPLVNYQLNALLKETEQVLHSMPHTYKLQPNYSIKQFEPSRSSEQLEQRAAAKRLRPFFG